MTEQRWDSNQQPRRLLRGAAERHFLKWVMSLSIALPPVLVKGTARRSESIHSKTDQRLFHPCHFYMARYDPAKSAKSCADDSPQANDASARFTKRDGALTTKNLGHKSYPTDEGLGDHDLAFEQATI